MRIFKEFNTKTKCPVCGTNKKGKAVLIPIVGTVEGGNVECKQIHLDCLDLCCISYPDGDLLFVQRFKDKSD